MTPSYILDRLMELWQEPWSEPAYGEAQMLLSRLRSLRQAPPPHTRLVLAADNILEQWGTRTEDGYRIRAVWGPPTPEGWYEPLFTIDYTDRLPRRWSLAWLWRSKT